MANSKPRIVILDGRTLNPGDLSWEGFTQLGDVTVYDASPTADVASRISDADVVISNKVRLDAELIKGLKQLRYIGVTATGYDIVDIEAARNQGVTVTNVPDYSGPSVAQATFALLLELTHHTGHHSTASKSGRWSDSDDFCFWDYPLIELDGLTMGIFGYGSIGQRVASLAAAFGMNVIVHSQSRNQVAGPDVEFVDRDELFRRSDVVSLHCPLTPETEGVVDLALLKTMKPSALLLNTSRGGLIVSADLAAALQEGVIAGAAVDVLESEPPPHNHPLLGEGNCIVTPHLAWATKSARFRLMGVATSNLKNYLEGTPVNVVS